MQLKKIPFEDFHQYVQEGLSAVTDESDNLTKRILNITGCHPYYTQQLAATVWDLLNYKKELYNASLKNLSNFIKD